jgi:Spy/CpxP family protein refolding chaperone
MKKRLLISLSVVFVIALAGAALAVGPGYGKGMGPCFGADTKLTPEQTQKLAAFQKDILPLKQKMLQLRTDLMTLRAQAAPDWKAIADKQKEMIDVRTEIQKKAAETGLTGFGPGPMSGRCNKGGMGMGRMGT